MSRRGANDFSRCKISSVGTFRSSPVMGQRAYVTFARIRDCRDRQGLTITQIARTLGLHRQTVAKWLARSRFERPCPPPRNSLLDPFKGRITRLLDTHPYSAQQNC